ncbi:hypothetical protein [Rubrivirga sp. IMCC43871]|uniref:hypothetical protein n=1 Tax=Rubrivirga sp. IMCC43871 TaxID=3391575 RepID=UPI00399007BD
MRAPTITRTPSARSAGRAVLALALVWAAGVAPVRAQAGVPSTPAALIQAMEAAAGRLDYDEASSLARTALERYAELTPDQLITVHTALGVLHHTRSEPVEARRQFAAALSIDPELRLESVLISPKTVEFFDAVRADLRAAGRAADPALAETRYVVLVDRRPTAAVRSLVAPGWGQFHKGDRTKGWAFAISAAATAAGALTTTISRADARADYLAAVTPEEIDETYRVYDRWHRARGAFVIGAAAVWAAALADALLTGAPDPPPVSIAPSSDGTGLSLRATF